MVTAKQLCEHLKPASISQVMRTGWDVMIVRGASLVATHVRIAIACPAVTRSGTANTASFDRSRPHSDPERI